jgi:hypothetical protein
VLCVYLKVEENICSLCGESFSEPLIEIVLEKRRA